MKELSAIFDRFKCENARTHCLVWCTIPGHHNMSTTWHNVFSTPICLYMGDEWHADITMYLILRSTTLVCSCLILSYMRFYSLKSFPYYLWEVPVQWPRDILDLSTDSWRPIHLYLVLCELCAGPVIQCKIPSTLLDRVRGWSHNGWIFTPSLSAGLSPFWYSVATPDMASLSRHELVHYSSP